MNRPMLHNISLNSTAQKSRRGVSILEVLFAIMITAIGLMGAISVFPAALLQVKRGQQADATAAVGMTGHHAFRTMGLARADRWLVYNSSNYVVANPPDGSIAYCIDPRFIEANLNDTSANTFPYGSSTSFMQRVTLSNGATGNPPPRMQSLMAESLFRVDDDLAYNRFTDTLNNVDQTQHAASLFAKDNSGNTLKRESHGHMSWMATLTPKLEFLPTGGVVEDRYILSVVVFYDRPNQLQMSGGFLPNEWELVVPAGGLYGGGIGGGDMLLQSTATAPEEQLRQTTLHRDQWIMLTNMRPTGNAPSGLRYAPVCRWYRVIDADESLGTSVNVTLSGADWEVAQNQTRAVVAQGVVAVFEKTIKLEPRN